MDLQNFPKMSSPDPERTTGREPASGHKRHHAGAASLAVGGASFCVIYVAPIAVALAIIGLWQSRRTADRSDVGMAIGGIALACIAVLFAMLKLIREAQIP